MSKPIQTIPISGFDPTGEPEIHVMADGTLSVVFESMPPDDVQDREEAFFDRFDQEMEQALGVPVLWEDRERFLIQSPAKDTLDRLTSFIQGCRQDVRGGPRTAKRGVRASIREAVEQAVAPAGFRFSGTEDAFVRRIAGGKQLLYSSLLDYRPVYKLSFTLGIELDTARSILQEFGLPGRITTQLEHFGLPSVRPWGAGFWLTAPGAEMERDEGFLEIGRGQGLWETGPDSLDSALEQATALIRKHILPFFERCQDAASIDHAMHAPASPGGSAGWWQRLQVFAPRRSEAPAPEEDTWVVSRRAIDSQSDPGRSMTGLAIAHLAGSSRFDDLVGEYRNALAAFPDADKQKFERLVEDLRSRSRPRQ